MSVTTCSLSTAEGWNAEHAKSLEWDGTVDYSSSATILRDKSKMLEAPMQVLASIEQMTNPSLLDIGAGDGSLTVHMSKLLGSRTHRAYDVVPPQENTQSVACMHCRRTPLSQRPETTTVTLFNGTELPEDDNSWDLVTLLFVLHHAGDAQVALLKDVRRVCKGYVLITEDINDPEFVERNKLHDSNGIFRTRPEWRDLFNEIGFTVHGEGGVLKKGVAGPQWFFILRPQ